MFDNGSVMHSGDDFSSVLPPLPDCPCDRGLADVAEALHAQEQIQILAGCQTYVLAISTTWTARQPLCSCGGSGTCTSGYRLTRAGRSQQEPSRRRVGRQSHRALGLAADAVVVAVEVVRVRVGHVVGVPPLAFSSTGLARLEWFDVAGGLR